MSEIEYSLRNISTNLDIFREIHTDVQNTWEEIKSTEDYKK
jgi:hypothetical protein